MFEEIHDPLKNIFEISLTKGVFPDDLKMYKIYKSGEKTDASNYRRMLIMLFKNSQKSFDNNELSELQ